MSDKQTSLQESISNQREVLITMLSDPLKRAAKSCSKVWGDREKLNHALTEVLHTMSYCKYLYTLDMEAVQISDNVSHEGLLTRHFGRERLLNEGEGVLNELLQQHPETDTKQVGQLIASTHKEAEHNQPPRAARMLFKYLRELMAS